MQPPTRTSVANRDDRRRPTEPAHREGLTMLFDCSLLVPQPLRSALDASVRRQSTTSG